MIAWHTSKNHQGTFRNKFHCSQGVLSTPEATQQGHGGGGRERERENGPGALPLLGLRVGCLGFRVLTLYWLIWSIKSRNSRMGKENLGHSSSQSSGLPRAFWKRELYGWGSLIPRLVVMLGIVSYSRQCVYRRWMSLEMDASAIKSFFFLIILIF